MKRFVVALVIVVVILAVVGSGISEAGTEQKSPEWLTNRIECQTPEKFLENYLIAIGRTPTEYYTDITIIMYLIYYTSQRINGHDDPFAGDLDMEKVFYSSMVSLYKVCTKENKFSISMLVSIENAIKKEHKKYYDEFMSNYYKDLADFLKDFHAKSLQRNKLK